MGSSPRIVKVGPFKYRILYSKKSWKKYAPDETDKVGLCLPNQEIILIKAWQLSERQIGEAICHELVHALFSLSGFENQTFKMSKNLHELEESIVLLLATPLYQFWLDNK